MLHDTLFITGMFRIFPILSILQIHVKTPSLTGMDRMDRIF